MEPQYEASQQPARLPVCYRHPDRETRLSCSNCGRPVCVDCVRSAAVGQKCLECAAPVEGQRVMDMAAVRRAQQRSTPVSFTILGVCVAIFLVGFLAPSLGNEVAFYGAQVNDFVAEGQWWRLLTAAFFHAGPTHILFNMWALYVFGPALERDVGSAAFASLYAASAAAGGAAFFLLAEGGQAVGASGAIFGLFGAWLVAAYRQRHTAFGQANLRQLGILLAINLALPLFIPGIGWQAHVGGLLAGALIMLIWTSAPMRGERLRRVGVALVVLALSLAVVIV